MIIIPIISNHIQSYPIIILILMQWSKKSNRQLGIARKDVAIGGDPKFREMSHFLTSYTHQERLVGMHHGDVSPRKDWDHAPKGAPKLEERLAFFKPSGLFGAQPALKCQSFRRWPYPTAVSCELKRLWQNPQPSLSIPTAHHRICLSSSSTSK